MSEQAKRKEPPKGGGFLFETRRELLKRGATTLGIVTFESLRAHDPDGKHGNAWPTLKSLSDGTGLSKRTLMRGIKGLVKIGVVTVIRTPRGSVYFLSTDDRDLAPPTEDEVCGDLFAERLAQAHAADRPVFLPWQYARDWRRGDKSGTAKEVPPEEGQGDRTGTAKEVPPETRGDRSGTAEVTEVVPPGVTEVVPPKKYTSENDKENDDERPSSPSARGASEPDNGHDPDLVAALREVGLKKGQIETCLARGADLCRKQLAWLPHRNPKKAAAVLYDSITQEWEAPETAQPTSPGARAAEIRRQLPQIAATCREGVPGWVQMLENLHLTDTERQALQTEGLLGWLPAQAG